MGLCNENKVYFFKNLYELKGFKMNRLMKEFTTKVQKKTIF